MCYLFLMKRPSFILLLCMITTIIIIKFFGPFILLALLLVGIIAMVFLKKHSFFFIIILALCLLCAFNASVRLNKQSAFAEYSNTYADFSAVLLSPMEKNEYYISGVFKIIDGPFDSSGEKILIKIYDSDKNTSLIPGDIYSFSCFISLPRPKTNPGGFDYRLYLKTKDILSIGKCNSSDMTFLGTSKNNLILNSLYKFRISVCHTLDNWLFKDNSDLIKNILFGENSLDDKILESYRKTGIAHILAVSGLHVGIIYNLILWLVKPLRLSDRFRFFMSGAFLMTYAAVTAFEVSVLRACIMHICSSGAVLMNRKNDIFNSLCLSAIIIMLINPLDLFSVAFQMSFCVFSLLLSFCLISTKSSQRKRKASFILT